MPTTPSRGGARRRRGACGDRPAVPPRESLPHALTIFLTSGERAEVIARLRVIARDRRTALLRLVRGGAGAVVGSKEVGRG